MLEHESARRSAVRPQLRRFSHPVLVSALLALAGCREAGDTLRRDRHKRSREAPALPARASHGERPRPVLPDLTSAELEAERVRLARAVPLNSIPPGEVNAQGPVIEEDGPGGAILPTDAFTDRLDKRQIPRGERRVPVGVHDLLLLREPTATITAGGQLIVRYETRRPSPGGAAYLGITLPEETLGVPRLRKHAPISSVRGRRHQVTFALQQLLAPKVDVTDMRSEGRGTIAYRLEMLDARFGTSRLFDGRVSFRCSDKPCAASGTFVQTPTVTLGPFVDLVTPTSAVISWDTDVPTAGRVLAIASGKRSVTFDSKQAGTHHEVTLSGLAADTPYRYYVLALDRRAETVATRPYSFATAPRVPRPFTFAVMSDSRSGVDVGEASYLGVNRLALEQLLRRAHESAAELVLFGGDLIDGYTTSVGAYRLQLRAWKQATQAFGALVPIYEAMGNHEALIDAWASGWAVDKPGPVNSQTVFAEAFVNPDNGPDAKRPDAPPYRETVFSFARGGAHFAVVNSNYWFRSHFERQDHPAASRGNREGTLTPEQLVWLDDDLGAACRGRAPLRRDPRARLPHRRARARRHVLERTLSRGSCPA